MADESNVLPTSRIVRWVAIGALLAFALVLYFRDGRTLPPLTAPAAGSPTTPADQPVN
jgi:hypothetical protein